ncbi:FAD-dependent monooxygenase [Streptomyces monticola]|uniref:FAD-dependent monooxygenase n=1 Tax=Streptomyces monticola TaxID=2666263 RepID=A0ABW2JX79_9ACTN
MAKKVLISGAGVAGSALAYWLHHHGFDVTLVERAPSPRSTGYAVDFRGRALDVLEQMGILDEVRGHETKMTGTTLVGAEGQQVGELPAEAFAGDLEVRKDDLTGILYRLTQGIAEYVFDDSISSATQDDSGVHVTFQRGPQRTFDFLVGADGVYSDVRKLVFAPHAKCVQHLGMSGVGFTTANDLDLDHRGLLCSAPGKAVYVFSAADADRMTVSLSFATESAAFDRWDRPEQEKLTNERFANDGWIVPRLLADMSAATDFYAASACQVVLTPWAEGRVVLAGDAAHCAAPTSGMGTSQALIGARLLAERLATTPDDHRRAFEEYESELRPYVEQNQALGREAVKMLGG